MRIIDAAVTDIRRACARIEGRVTLTLAPRPGVPAVTRTLRASVAAHDPKGRDLRTRLVAGAVEMALRPDALSQAA